MPIYRAQFSDGDVTWDGEKPAVPAMIERPIPFFQEAQSINH